MNDWFGGNDCDSVCNRTHGTNDNGSNLGQSVSQTRCKKVIIVHDKYAVTFERAFSHGVHLIMHWTLKPR